MPKQNAKGNLIRKESRYEKMIDKSMNEMYDKDHDGLPDRIDSTYSIPERDEQLDKDLEKRGEELRRRSNGLCR